MGWVIVAFWVAATAVASWIGWSVKGRPLTGFLLGIFLGWLGVIITAFLPLTAEKRVQRQVRDTGVAEEAARRRAGLEPWSRDVPPPAAPQP
jgi:hypothetical protein